MKRLFAYARVSTAKQGEKGVSLQEQRDAITRYAERHSLQIGEWFEERQTAAKRGRPVFNAMMQALKKGSAAGVVIHKIDRSARNLRDWADLGELIDSGVEVHFANEPLDLKSRGGRLSADILAVVAADFIRNNREETRKGFYGRLKQGIYPLNAPLGYEDRGGGKLKTIDPVRGPIVRYAFERYATGEASLHMLLEDLSARGLRNRRGNPITLTGLATILRNPFYAGVIRLRKTGESFPGAHELLIKPELFKRVQDVLDGKKPRRVSVHDYVFRRLFACATCKRSLIASKHKGHVYYRCQTLSCPSTCLREEQLDNALRLVFRGTAISASAVEKISASLKRSFGNTAEREAATRLQLEGTLGNVEGRLQRLTDAYVDGHIERAIFDDRRSALLLDKEGVQQRLKTIRVDLESAQQLLGICLELAKTPELLYEKATVPEKRRLIEIVTSNRVVSGKNVEISRAEPFRFLASAEENHSCAPIRVRPRTKLWTKKRIKKVADQLFTWAMDTSHREAVKSE